MFDTGFLHILFDDRARVPRDKAGKPKVDRPQERIDFLVQTMTQRKDKIIIAAPALAEFLLLAFDRRSDYLTIIRRKAVFEIAGFDDPEAVELVEHWLKTGDGKRPKPSAPETWAKMKYDRQIIAIAATRRVECIYSTDSDLHKLAAQLNVKCLDLSDLPLPPPRQMHLDEIDDSKDKGTEATPVAPPLALPGGSSGPPEGQAGPEGGQSKTNDGG